jgi:hypothetical protein
MQVLKAAANAVGLPADFDPFADDMSVLLGGILFKDVGEKEIDRGREALTG